MYLPWEEAMTETSPCPTQTTIRSGVVGALQSVSQMTDAAIFGWPEGKSERFVLHDRSSESSLEPYGKFEDDPDG